MDYTNFAEFIKQSDNDNNSSQKAIVEYDAWRQLAEDESQQPWSNSLKYRMCNMIKSLWGTSDQ